MGPDHKIKGLRKAFGIIFNLVVQYNTMAFILCYGYINNPKVLSSMKTDQVCFQK